MTYTEQLNTIPKEKLIPIVEEFLKERFGDDHECVLLDSHQGVVATPLWLKHLQKFREFKPGPDDGGILNILNIEYWLARVSVDHPRSTAGKVAEQLWTLYLGKSKGVAKRHLDVLSI